MRYLAWGVKRAGPGGRREGVGKGGSSKAAAGAAAQATAAVQPIPASETGC